MRSIGNHNVNPVYGVFNGINSQFTGKDFLDNTPMSRSDGITDIVASVLPVGKVGKVAKGLMGLEKTAVKDATHTVYQGFDKGVVKYVGLTSRDPLKRFGEHVSAGGPKSFLTYQAVADATHLSKTSARVLEQRLINLYGLEKNGGQLLNKINSIAPKNWWQHGIK
jgi:hypothetical protein